MKQRIKSIVSICAAMMLLLGSQSIAFAAVSAAEESETEAAVSQVEKGAEESIAATDNLINASPNTGIDYAPIVAAILAFASVPVIACTSRKKKSQ